MSRAFKKFQWMRCKATTKKGKQCSCHANGSGYCHVHDPDGTYQRQQRGELRDGEYYSGKGTREAYYGYLRSAQWQRKADNCKRSWSGRCALCYSDKGIQAHHRTYKRLFDERPGDLICLCDDCHERHHEVLPQPPHV